MGHRLGYMFSTSTMISALSTMISTLSTFIFPLFTLVATPYTLAGVSLLTVVHQALFWKMKISNSS